MIQRGSSVPIDRVKGLVPEETSGPAMSNFGLVPPLRRWTSNTREVDPVRRHVPSLLHRKILGVIIEHREEVEPDETEAGERDLQTEVRYFPHPLANHAPCSAPRSSARA